ncbi:hypothetical protein [Porticoccus sp.]
MIYFSFSGFPELKNKSFKQRIRYYREINKNINLGKRFSLILVVSFFFGLCFSLVMANESVTGDLLGGVTIGVMFVVWMLGYLYVLNTSVRAEVKKLVSLE